MNTINAYPGTIVADLTAALIESAEKEEVVTITPIHMTADDAMEAFEEAWSVGDFGPTVAWMDYYHEEPTGEPTGIFASGGGCEARLHIVGLDT